MPRFITSWSFLLLCLLLVETSSIMLAADPLQAEAGHIGYGPVSPAYFPSPETVVTETEQVAAAPGWLAFDIRNFWMRADLRVRPETASASGVVLRSTALATV
jgi:hypothetical protein